MFKSVRLFLSCSVISMSCLAGPQTLDCQSSSNFEVNLNELETVAAVADGCPAPEKVDYAKICSYSRDKKLAPEDSELNYLFEQQILKMSCATEGKDSPQAIKQKTSIMWNTYRTKFACDSLEFNVPNGNILKFSMNFNFPDFIYTMVNTYDLDMDFKDPADNKTIIEYLDEEIAKTTKFGVGKIKEMKEVRALLVEQKIKQQKLAKLK
jgi:hypothetical protein